MSPWLPYLVLGLLLFAVLAFWIWRVVDHRSAVQVWAPRQHRVSVRRIGLQRDLGERIFGPGDWDFVSRETPRDIQRMFQNERSVLVIAWLRRTRMRISQVMRAHVIAVRQSEGLRVTMEIRLALSYVSLLVLCNLLIGLIWLRGPISTRRLVTRTVRSIVEVRTAFERLMAVVDPVICRAFESGFNPGTVRN